MAAFLSSYNVAPSAIDVLAPPVVLNTTTSAAVGNGVTNIVTSPTLPAGTYFVGANFQVSSTTTFTNTDAVFFEIADTPSAFTVYPVTLLTGYNQFGSSPALMAASVTGVIVLPTSQTISWALNCTFGTATGKTGFVGNAFYQRIA
jgi:hypothetical protein